MPPIKHIWFDFSETISRSNNEAHAKLRYETYAGIVGKPVTPLLIAEFDDLLKRLGSHSAVFVSLGKTSDFWSSCISSHAGELLTLADSDSPAVFEKLHALLPISIFSNVHANRLLPALGVNPAWFTHFLGPDEVKKPKPALEGFEMLIGMSKLPAENILYVGDHIEKELLPARSLGMQTGLMWGNSPEVTYSFSKFRDILAIL